LGCRFFPITIPHDFPWKVSVRPYKMGRAGRHLSRRSIPTKARPTPSRGNFGNPGSMGMHPGCTCRARRGDQNDATGSLSGLVDQKLSGMERFAGAKWMEEHQNFSPRRRSPQRAFYRTDRHRTFSTIHRPMHLIKEAFL
jgi:hypothetical protein